jgi:hypothetical protein
MANSYPRESVEFVPVSLWNTTTNTPVTSGVEFTITQGIARPTGWFPAVTLGSQVGFMIGDYPIGTYTLWAQITSGTQVVVLIIDTFTID